MLCMKLGIFIVCCVFLSLSVVAQDQFSVYFDSNKFTLTTKNAATGDLVVTLRHLPNKSAPGVADGEITNAGGATDFAVTYPVVVQ